jgi:tRNA-Thr(GGU) m(6)t(6)A37 methyltransferase TsaA
MRQAALRLIKRMKSPLLGPETAEGTAMTPTPDVKAVQGQDVREGEIAVPLPDRSDASVYFIGRIRTPWKTRKDCPKNARAARETGAICTLELDPRWVPGLKDIERCSHLVVFYWMDKARRDLAVQVPGHLGKPRGTFALRSPVRPNPIAMSVVKLVKAEGNKVEVVALDCIDGTPLLDIQPYHASTDSIPDAVTGP